MNDEIKKQTGILKEILKWIKISSIKEVKEVLANNLIDNNRKLVYHFSDGEKNIREICELTGVKSTGTISDYWNQWKKIGIVESIPAKRGERVKKIFELKDFGIEIPKIENIQNEKESQEGLSEEKILPKEETPKIEKLSLEQKPVQEDEIKTLEEE